jgi:hypothetical protein
MRTQIIVLDGSGGSINTIKVRERLHMIQT